MKQSAELEKRLEPLRPFAARLAEITVPASVNEDREHSKIIVGWHESGLAVRAILGWVYFKLAASVPGKRGDFFLACFDDEDDGSSDDAWEQSSRQIFVSKFCRFQSENSLDEVARFLSLPPPRRDRAIEICERYRSEFSLEHERLTLGIGGPEDHRDPQTIADYALELVALANELPSRWEQASPTIARLHACGYCRADVFLAAGATECVHCGAPV